MLSKQEIIGFVLAPLPMIIPLLLLFGIILLDRPDDSWNILEAMLQIVVLGYGMCLVIGAPVHFWLRHVGETSLAPYLRLTATGIFVAGLILGGVEKLVRTSAEENPFGLTTWSRFGLTALFCLAIATIPSAFLFWYVAVRRPRMSASGSPE
jgi:hypothetical protein